MSDNTRTPGEFIAAYGPDAPVVVGRGMQMTLGQALAAEQLSCPADATTRQDPANRIGYLARILAAGGSLRPEDNHLTGTGE